MINHFKIKVLFLIIGLFFTNCSNSNLETQTQKIPESKGGIILATPTPFLGQKAKMRGENVPLKLAESFETSILQQDQPNIWLEFENENGERRKVFLSDKIINDSNASWKAIIKYRFVKNNSKIPNEIAQAINDFTIYTVHYGNELEKLEVDSPNGVRRMIKEEIDEILLTQIELMKERYEELEQHFNSQK